MSNRTEKSRLIASFLGFLCTSLSFLLMPSMPDKPDGGWLRILPGLLFWLGLLVGVGTQLALSAQRRRWLRSHPNAPEELQSGRPGVICFCRNKPGKLSDLALVLSALGFAICLIAGADGLTPYVFMALTFFSFCAHCIFNGLNLRFIREIEANRRTGKKGRHEEGRVG